MTIADVRQTALPARVVPQDIAVVRPPARAAAAAPFGPAVTLSVSAAAAGPSSDLETLADFKDVAIAAKRDIADAARRLKAVNPDDVAATEGARAALDRELAVLFDVVIDGIRRSEGADLLAAAIGADAVARPLAVNIVV